MIQNNFFFHSSFLFSQVHGQFGEKIQVWSEELTVSFEHLKKTTLVSKCFETGFPRMTGRVGGWEGEMFGNCAICAICAHLYVEDFTPGKTCNVLPRKESIITWVPRTSPICPHPPRQLDIRLSLSLLISCLNKIFGQRTFCLPCSEPGLEAELRIISTSSP